MRLKEFIEIQRNGNVCKLCNETFTGENATPSSCQHAFHVECLKTWTKEHTNGGSCKCPLVNCSEAYTAIFIRSTPGGTMKEAISLAVDNQCPVCFEDMKPPIATPECCNHCFCLTCLSDWCKVQHACPLDRKTFELMLLHDYIGGPVVDRRVPPPIEAPIEPVVEDNTYCEVCHSPDDEANLLLCDNCDKGYHTYCLSNPLSEIPEGDWFCPECEPLVRDAEAEQNEIEQIGYRLGGLDSDSAEESEGLEHSDNDSDDRENLPFMESFTIRTQERLVRQAMSRHRGAGLLRDLIENLENRARNEQRQRRTRSRRNQQRRRRVRVDDSIDEFLNPPQPERQNEPTTSNGRGGLRRKRRRILGYDSSDSEVEDDERAGPSNSQSPDHNIITPRSTPPRKRLRILDDTADSLPSPIRPQRNLHRTHDTSEVPSQRLAISTPSHSDGEEASIGTEDKDESSTYRPIDNSSRDIFASFSTDQNLSGIAEEIHSIASRRRRISTKSRQTRKRKTKRRRRRTTRKSTGNVANASGLVKRAQRTLRKSTTRRRRRTTTGTRRSTKRTRLNSSHRRIQESMSSALQSSPISTRTRRSDSKVTISSKLSIFGTDPTCGLVADLENNEGNKKRTAPSTSKSPQSVHTPSSSEGYLSRLLAQQDALHRFNSFNMRINPDNSVSPPPIKLPPKVSITKPIDAPESKPKPDPSKSHSTVENGVKHSEVSTHSKKSAAAISDSQASSSKSQIFPNCNRKMEEKSLGESNPGPSTTSNGIRRSEELPSATHQHSISTRQSTWTSESIDRVRKLIFDYLRTDHPSLTDEEIRKELAKRAITKVIRRTPEKVTDARIRTLIDQYVQFFRINPLQH
ncbi:unnamed protein product [Rodentolepis nana]|uniref:PHD and RING finger domain-containing protein 1 n=1 Tax=Rodentolepis nana TaxID=102285 RepID=A0A158QI82_RODNA|nr:unnamed protein product [Rodentolepis nana]